MTCSKERPFKLCVNRGLEDSDDEKTPEYPLSDDHPLSLHNRAKLLSERTYLSSKYVNTLPFSPQIPSPPLKPTKTAVDSKAENNILHSDESFTNKTSQNMDSAIIQNVSHERVNRWLLETSTRIKVLKDVPEALDLAVISKPKSSDIKQNIPVSLRVRSLLDTSMEGTRAFKSLCADDDILSDKASLTSDGISKTQSMDQISSTDSNNNTGLQSSPQPSERKVFENAAVDKSKSRTDDYEISKTPTSSSSNLLTPNSTSALTCDSIIDVDAYDKNVPPKLSPVTVICPKTEATANSISPTFPPTLMPIKMYSSGGSPICEYSTGNSGTVDKLRSPRQSPTSGLDLALKQTVDKNVLNDQKSSGSPEKSPSDCLPSVEANGDSNVDACESSAKSNKVGKARVRIDTQSQSPGRHEALPVCMQHNPQSRAPSNECLSKEVINTRTFTSQPMISPSSYDSVSLGMDLSMVSRPRNSRNCEEIMKQQFLPTHDKRESPMTTPLSVTLSENSPFPQLNQNSDAKSGTNVTSSYCDPHSIQRAYYVVGSNDFGHNSESEILRKHTETLPSNTVQSRSFCPVIPKTTLAHPPFSSTKESFALPTTVLTCATVSPPSKSTAESLQPPQSSSLHQHFISSYPPYFTTDINPPPYAPSLTPLVTTNAQLVTSTNHERSRVELKRHMNPKQDNVNHCGYSLQKRFFQEPPIPRTSAGETQVVSRRRRRVHQNSNSVSTAAVAPQNYSSVSTAAVASRDYTGAPTVATAPQNYSSASTVATAPQNYRSVSTVPVAPQNYSSVSTVAITPQNYSGVSTVPVAPQNYSGVSTVLVAPENYSSVSTVPVASRDYRSVSTVATAPQNYSSVSTAAVASRDCRSVSTVATAPQNYSSVSTVVVAPRNHSSASTVATAPQNYCSASSVAVAHRNYSSASSVAVAPQSYSSSSTSAVAETPQNYNSAFTSTVTERLQNCNIAATSTVAETPRIHNSAFIMAQAPKNYNSASNADETPKMPPLLGPSMKTAFHGDAAIIQETYNFHCPAKTQRSLQLQERVGGNLAESAEPPKTFVSSTSAVDNPKGNSIEAVTPCLRLIDQEPLSIRPLQGRSPTTSGTKYALNKSHLHRDPLPSNNQQQPLDLSSKHQTTYQNMSQSFNEIPVSSSSPMTLNLNQASVGENDNSTSANHSAPPESITTAVSPLKSKNEHQRAGSEKALPNADCDGCNEFPPPAKQQKVSDISSPVKQICLQNNDDGEREISLPTNTCEQRKRKSLPIPMENNLPLNPDERSYSHLAIAAIMSKGKKTLLERSNISELEHVLDFLQSNDTCNLVRKGKGFQETNNIMARLRNGELIDLTSDNDDILSISSDENAKDINELSEPITDPDNKKHVVSRHVKDLGESADNGNETFSSRNESLSGLFHERKVLEEKSSSEKSSLLTDLNLDENSCEQSQYDTIEKSAILQQFRSVTQDSFSLLDPTNLSRIKEQSLTFSGPQKAWMAKRIQDIISKNAKLLPEYMRPFDSTFTSPSSLSDGCSLPNASGQCKTYPCKFETERTPLINGDFQNPYTESVPPSLPLKVKRSMSLDTDSSSSLWSPNTDIHPHAGPEIHQKSSQCEMYLTTDTESIVPDSFNQATEEREETGESPSPYKTVWQTQFLTDRPPSRGEERRRNRSHHKPLQNSDDIFLRLELMQNAANSLNQVTGTDNNGEKSNAGTVKKRRKRSAAKRPATNLGESVPKVCPEPPPLLHQDPRCDIVRLPPPATAQLNPYMPSTFVVAPYYAMAYPLCYPAFQRPPAPDPALLMPPHGPMLDSPANRRMWSNGKKGNRKLKPPPVDPTWKRMPLHIERNGDPGLNSFINHNPDIPLAPPSVTHQTGINPFDRNGNIRNGDLATNLNTVIRNTHNSEVIFRSHLPDHPSNAQGLLDSESNCDTYRVQTRNEDGLTVLSMQYTGERESRDSALKSNNNAFESNHTYQHSCRVDLNLLNSFSYETELPPVVPPEVNNRVIHSSVPPVNVAQNLATLALASEKREKIASPRTSPQVARTDKPLDETVPARPESDVDSDAPELTVDLSSRSQDDDLASRPTLDVASTNGHEHQNGKSKSLTLGITEKERQVTEMLAAMMQNRNLSSQNKPDKIEI